jgi:hypothetical protein
LIAALQTPQASRRFRRRSSGDLPGVGTGAFTARFSALSIFSGDPMGRGLMLWLIGIPLPVILVLYFLGYLH